MVYKVKATDYCVFQP